MTTDVKSWSISLTEGLMGSVFLSIQATLSLSAMMGSHKCLHRAEM